MANRRIKPSEHEDPSGEATHHGDGLTVVELHMALAAAIDPERVPTAFGGDASAWLGEPAGTDAAGLHRYSCDLRLRVSPESRALFRKSAIVSVGVPERGSTDWVVQIEWRAATLAPLFPVFIGRLVIGFDRITVDGYYAPPFGLVGYVMDRAVLSIVARGTARWFLTQVASALRRADPRGPALNH